MDICLIYSVPNVRNLQPRFQGFPFGGNLVRTNSQIKGKSLGSEFGGEGRTRVEIETVRGLLFLP